jgi:hypothetical protein
MRTVTLSMALHGFLVGAAAAQMTPDAAITPAVEAAGGR